MVEMNATDHLDIPSPNINLEYGTHAIILNKSDRQFLVSSIIRWELNRLDPHRKDISKPPANQVDLITLSSKLYATTNKLVSTQVISHEHIDHELSHQSAVAVTTGSRSVVLRLIRLSARLKKQLVDELSIAFGQEIQPNERCFQYGPREWQKSIIEQVISECAVESACNEYLSSIDEDMDKRLTISSVLNGLSNKDLWQRFMGISGKLGV